MTTPVDILGVLTNARPDDLDVPARQVRDRIYRAALAAPVTAKEQRWWRGRLVAIPVAGAGVIAATLILALGIQPLRTVSPEPAQGLGASTDTSAQAVLLAAASAAGKAPTRSAATYWHTSTQLYEAGSNANASHTSVVDAWVAQAPNDPGWFTLPMPGQPYVHQAAPGSDPYHTRFDVLDRFLTFAELQELPTNPAALKAYLLAIPPHHPGLPVVPVSDRLFGACIQLADAPATPAVRAAAFRLLAGLPGLTSLGQVRDPAGRVGVGVADAYTGDGPATELIIDPSAGSLLALENVTRVSGHRAVIYYEAILAEGWTNTVQPPTGAA